ncbi:MAG: hypothetical protein ACQES1_00820 [Bacteroidota bacterium]
MTRWIHIIIILLFLGSSGAEAQRLVLFHSGDIYTPDSIYRLEKVPVIPNSFNLFYDNGVPVDQRDYKLQHFEGKLHLSKKLRQQKLFFSYRAYPVDISSLSVADSPWQISKKDSIKSDSTTPEQIRYHPDDYRSNSRDESKLKTSGSIARGVNVGSNQNAVLNSNLNLQIEGELSKNLRVRASLTDRNIPIQPDGTNQKLQEFDKVFIEVYNPDFSLKAGDILLEQKEDHFMRYAKNARGAKVSGNYSVNNAELTSDLGVSVSRGNYQRMEFQGEEGNQGPYKLQGANDEKYIVIVSGSERIYLDGELLTRGQSKDYIIDYNTGELTFTANRLITKDSRIKAEFEYRSTSYNRMMFNTNHEIKTEKSSFFIRYFNESDGKNQPIDQTLDTERRQFLSGIGDNLSDALYPTWDSVGFESSQVLYRLTDTVVDGMAFDSVFVYSSHPDSAVYQVSFSNVGQNQGNYIKINNSAANGRVFKWVAPENGQPSGNYAPVTKLITPKKQQMLSLGGDYQAGNSTKLFYQMSFSDKDINTYSDLDAADDQGVALSGGVKQDIIKSSKQKLNAVLNYDFIQRHFQSLERFRESEFKRNWDLDSELAGVNEHAGKLKLIYAGFDKAQADFRSSVIHRPGEYTGSRQTLNSSYRSSAWDIQVAGDLLNTRQNNYESFFLKNDAKLGKLFPKWQMYGHFKQEWQEGYLKETNTMSGNSFRFLELNTWLKQGKQSDNTWKLAYQYRLDDLPVNGGLKHASEAQQLGLNFRLLNSKNNRIDGGLKYRELKILRDVESADTKPQDNFAGQIDYNHESFNGLITGNLFYQSGAGLELKKEYSYLKVPDGQGVYTWTDYNDNGVEELNEFEEAVYQDQANYIRIYTPGNDYIKTFNNSLNLNLIIRPEQVVNKNTGFAGMIRKLSNRFNINLSDKNTATGVTGRYMPVSYLLPDSSLMYFNNNLRNVLSWNRTGTVFSADFIYQRQGNRSQLVNGQESRENETLKFRMEWKISRVISVNNTTGYGTKLYDSQFFSDKNYRISEKNNMTELRVQPDVNMRFRGFFEVSHCEDGLSGENSKSINPGVEYRNNAIASGMLSLRFDYVHVKYSGETGTSLAWQMLEALQPGNNYRWNLSFQKRLSNGLQLNLNYQGRKPGDEQIIHTGGVQLRAYF